MSFSQRLTLPWSELDPKVIETAVVAAAKRAGAVATLDPGKLDPGAEPELQTETDDDDEEIEEEIIWYFGFPTGVDKPGRKYAWAALHFRTEEVDEDVCCYGWYQRGDYEQRCAAQFTELVEDFVEEEGGSIDEM